MLPAGLDGGVRPVGLVGLFRLLVRLLRLGLVLHRLGLLLGGLLSLQGRNSTDILGTFPNQSLIMF